MQLSNLREVYVCTFWFNISVFKNTHFFGAMHFLTENCISRCVCSNHIISFLRLEFSLINFLFSGSISEFRIRLILQKDRVHYAHGQVG